MTIFSSGNNSSAFVAMPADYLALLKPRVMSLVIFTALAGMMIAPVHMNFGLQAIALFAIALGAGASGALNMWYDADIDALMTRTQKRPIPAGKISPDNVLAFGLSLAVFAVLLLGLVANWLAAALLAFTIFFYVVVYTMWLKRSTPQNIVIGGAAGAFPPMVGYLASTGYLSLAPCILSAIIFFWTPPHFWALALVKAKDYQIAHIPMMPNVKGRDHTCIEILIYTLILVPLGLVPWIIGAASWVYGLIAAVAGTLMLALSLRVFIFRHGKTTDKMCWQLFSFSIFYLSLLFAVLVIERLWVS